MINDTSFWSARVGFNSGNGSRDSSGSVSTSGLWDNPEGNPHPPDEDSSYTSPWKPRGISRRDWTTGHVTRQNIEPLNPSPSGILWYNGPIQYKVRKTGYYCVGQFPLYWPSLGCASSSIQQLSRSLLSPTPNQFDKNLPTFLITLHIQAKSFSRIRSMENFLLPITPRSM